MRIMLDSNILISIAIFNSNRLKELLVYIFDKHTLVLSSSILNELDEVVHKKFPDKIDSFKKFIHKLPYEFNYVPSSNLKNTKIQIRDLKDLPILVSAIVSDVDIFITGDKDFENVHINKPKIMSATEFLIRYKK